MRELKFRFVNTGDGAVYKPITLVGLCQRIEIPRRIVLESENGDFVDTDDFLDQLENGELIAEQYTGLKEIYEGDVVKIATFKLPFFVEYHTPSASFLATTKEGLCVEFDDFYAEEDTEVVGNIHENQEHDII